MEASGICGSASVWESRSNDRKGDRVVISVLEDVLTMFPQMETFLQSQTIKTAAL